jgi:hypothetical protein
VRAVFDRLEQLEIRYFVTGSVAAAAYGRIRQTFDTDVVVELAADRFAALVAPLAGAHAIADPTSLGDVTMASLIDTTTGEMVALVLEAGSPWNASAMTRRIRRHLPGLGDVRVSSVEDLILAKLRWSEGTSELQLRDCAELIALNAARLDDGYLDEWADRLGLRPLLERVRAT